LDRTYRALGAKEYKLGFVRAVHARSKPMSTSSDVSGVVVMFLRPSAVPRGECRTEWRERDEMRKWYNHTRTQEREREGIEAMNRE